MPETCCRCGSRGEGDRRLAIGTGPSKQTAEKDAARFALQLLRSIDPAAGISIW